MSCIERTDIVLVFTVLDSVVTEQPLWRLACPLAVIRLMACDLDYVHQLHG